MSRIVRFHQTGGPEVLRIDEVEVRAPKAGEIRIAVKALGLNRAGRCSVWDNISRNRVFRPGSATRRRARWKRSVKECIKRADTAGQPCYLETAQPENVGFYERLGFRQVVDMVEPQSGLRLWTFRRDPAAPQASTA
jgi:hypothetical protein